MKTVMKTAKKTATKPAVKKKGTEQPKVEEKCEEIIYPESYAKNSPDEMELLAIADNFHRYYLHLFPERKPLLLCPVNECGVKKFVSTTLRPAPQSHPEFFYWQGCASFVADFLNLNLLDPPFEPPKRLFSPTCVMRTQRATCFEYATLLCSLLLGFDYDAYCVSGYAVREMCLLDQRLQDCPLLDTQAVSEQPVSEQPSSRQLTSRFVKQQEIKKKEEEAAALHKKEEKDQSEKPYELPQVHCWVLVKSGCRGVQENIFIDPLTGIGYSTAADSFLGIESMWNDYNCYVNKQDCGSGCGDLVFDLQDIDLWEPVIYGAASKEHMMLMYKNLMRSSNKVVEVEEETETQEVEPPTFFMTLSWVSYIVISKIDLDKRFPRGQKMNRYKKAKLERYALYLRADGLVTRLCMYKDTDCTEVAMVKEWYQHRRDHLEQREINKVNGFTTDCFKRGRRFHLIVHRYQSLTIDGIHEMEFRAEARLDDLSQRVVSPGEMTETFQCRRDFLDYRHVVFSRYVQFPEDKDADPDIQLLQVVECFHRNRSKPANEDVAERVFLSSEGRIEVTAHPEDDRILPAKMTFGKTSTVSIESTEQRRAEELRAHMEHLRSPTLRELVSLMMDEEMVWTDTIKGSLKELRDIVACREEEEKDIHLILVPWSTAGAARACQMRKDLEREAAKEQRWLQGKERSILAPVLRRLEDPQTLSSQDAKQLRQDCHAHFKRILASQENNLWNRYKLEKQVLLKKQEWYQKNQQDMTEEQEEEFHKFCCEKTLNMHVIRTRLKMHKEEAPVKLLKFDQNLREDERLAPLLLK